MHGEITGEETQAMFRPHNRPEAVVPLSKISGRDKVWYLKDKYGWNIVTFKNKPFKSLLRIVCQNIRKVVG